MFSYTELYISTSDFSIDEVLGSGGFGQVYPVVQRAGPDLGLDFMLWAFSGQARSPARPMARLTRGCSRSKKSIPNDSDFATDYPGFHLQNILRPNSTVAVQHGKRMNP